MVLSDHTINELYDVFERRFRDRIPALDSFIDALTFESVTPSDAFSSNDYPDLRDPDDLPILVSAVEAKCDYLMTGDKDLQMLSPDTMKIVSPAEFIKLTGADQTDP